MDLKGRAALVTGGGTGLGRAIALALAATGCRVMVNYSRSEADAVETVEAVRLAGVDGEAVRADVTDERSVRAMVSGTIDRFGDLDIVVNNAGYTRPVPLADLDAITDEDWDRTLSVNVRGAFSVTRSATPALRRAGGAVVNVSSMAGLQALGSSLPYGVSKAALLHLTRGLATALAPDVRVNAIAPGFMATRWTEPLADRIDEFTSAALLRRPVDVSDVAAMAVELIRNDGMTGQTIVVDAGTVLH